MTLSIGCFECLVPVVEKYEGTIDKFIGDEIMTIFGVPVAHENDAERAVLTALEMIKVIEDFNSIQSISIGLHFGINTGLVFAGEIGSSERQDYSIIGDTVNLASRLAAASKCWQILVGSDTHRLVKSVFRFKGPQLISVKGKSNLISAYEVLGFKTKTTRARWLETQGISSPLVGRDNSRKVMINRIDQLLIGRGGIISIIGEAGVGKSRLISEIKNSQILATQTDAVWLEGRSLSYGGAISYWPFQEILRQWANITEEDDEATTWSKLENKVDRIFADKTADVLPYLAILLNLELKGKYAEQIRYLNSEAMGTQVYLSTRRFFQRLAQMRPLILVFEDFHWADESSMNLLDHLIPLVEDVPLLIICIGRIDPDNPETHLCHLAKEKYATSYTEIFLSPLSQAESVQLLGNIFSLEGLSAQAQALIIRKTEGNPLFIEEVIRALIDMGVLVKERQGDRWQATTNIEMIAVPDTIQGVIIARVDRLEDEVKQVLRTASVIGRSFLYRVLKAVDEKIVEVAVVSKASTDLDERLDKLKKVELIREKKLQPELEYIFKHALVQEATYESILLKKKRQLHAEVGRVIENLFDGRLEEFYGLLAYHYARAEAWEKANEYLLKAGDQAGNLAADMEALNYYQQAIDTYSRAFGDYWNPLQRAVLERKMGEALFRRGEHAQALEYLQRALTILGHSVPTSRRSVRLAIINELFKQTFHRLLPDRLRKPLVSQVNETVKEKERLYHTMSWIVAFSDSMRSLLLTLKELNLSERNGYAVGIVRGGAKLATVWYLIGRFGLAQRYCHLAASVAETLRHPGAVGLSYQSLVLNDVAQANWDAALKHAALSVKAYREAGDIHGIGFVGWRTSIIDVYRANYSHALETATDLVQLGQESGDKQVWSWGESMQGLTFLCMGELDEAVAHLEKSIELAESLLDRVYVSGHLGQCYLRQGKLQRALDLLEEYQRLRAENQLRTPNASCYLFNALTDAYTQAVEESGIEEKSVWLQKTKTACKAAIKQANYFRPAISEAMRLRGRYEWLLGKRRRALKWWRRGLRQAQDLGILYEFGMTNLEMGGRLKDRVHLETAERVFKKIGAEFELSKTQLFLESSLTS